MTIASLKASFDASILKNTTLILPTVSTGNIPQLILDLLIDSIDGTARLGSLQSPYVLNMCGPDAFGNSKFLALPMEVYFQPDRQWTLLQFRAPVIQACANEFCESLLTWITSIGFKSIFLLVSADAAYRTDSLIEGTPSFRSFGPSIPSLSVKPLESELKTGKLKGAAMFPEFLEKLEKYNLSQLCSGIIVFTLEGDNMQDTLMTWEILQPALNLPSSKVPVSWNEIYGTAMNESYQMLY